MRMKNPFRYGSRVTGGAFFDRERIVESQNGVYALADPLLAYHLASK